MQYGEYLAGMAFSNASLGYEDKLAFMTQNALNDACSLTNPRKASLEEIVNIFKARM
ncbi:hypothetical protein [Photobacterium aquimaris]|uniref:hypothetical protein n=1 Tax=Photobacterium aquimaris TaxID=512643 RepID=UPI000A8A3F49|nr:hypothetical protein [Photobacterium aquimaris]